MEKIHPWDICCFVNGFGQLLCHQTPFYFSIDWERYACAKSDMINAVVYIIVFVGRMVSLGDRPILTLKTEGLPHFALEFVILVCSFLLKERVFQPPHPPRKTLFIENIQQKHFFTWDSSEDLMLLSHTLLWNTQYELLYPLKYIA